MFQRTNNTRKNKQTEIRKWGENEASRCLDTSRHLILVTNHFLVCFSFWLFNIVVHYPTYVKKWKEVQMLLFQTSREIIFYFQHFIQVCFYFLGKKTGGRGPSAPPLATALSQHWHLNRFLRLSKEYLLLWTPKTLLRHRYYQTTQHLSLPYCILFLLWT